MTLFLDVDELIDLMAERMTKHPKLCSELNGDLMDFARELMHEDILPALRDVFGSDNIINTIP